MSRVRATFKCKVAMFIPVFLLFIQLHVYCCSYSVRPDSPHSLSARRVLQCAAAAAYKSSSVKERSWVRVYASMIRRISLVIRRRVSSMLQREQLHLDANFYRRALKSSSSSRHRLPQQRRPQRRLAPAAPARSVADGGRQLRFEDGKPLQAVKQHAETDQQMALHEADAQKQDVEEQKRFVPAGPNPLHNRR